jgi:hypothetical protein
MCLWWETRVENNASSNFFKKNRGIFCGKKEREKKKLIMHDFAFNMPVFQL